MDATERKGFLGFHPQFWVVNSIELVERGAYYGMLAVFTVYMVRRGFAEAQAGLFVGLLQPLLYFLPPFAAAFAQWFGFRRTIVVAFALATVGYLVLANVASPATILLGIVVFGAGAGMFKPVAAAVVAQASPPERRSFAFTIYYMGINLGAFFVPLAIAYFLVSHGLYAQVFYLCAALAAVNFVLALVVFRDLKPREDRAAFVAKLRRVAEVVRHPIVLALLALTALCAYAYFTRSLGLFGKGSTLMLAGAATILVAVVVLFRDAPFATLLLIYSGLWFMYAQFQFWAPVYMLNFRLMPTWFNEAYFATLNPLVIILLGVPLGKLVEKLPSLPTVVAGVAIYAAGILVLGLTGSPVLFVLGTVIVSVAELAAHPSFLSYVSKTAREDRQAVYLGLSFIPVGVGLAVGAALGGDMYESIAHGASRPSLFWAIVSAVGFATAAAFILYNRWLHRKTRDAAAPRGAFALLTRPAVALLALLLVPVVLFAGMGAGTAEFTALTSEDGGSASALAANSGGWHRVAQLDGTTDAGQSTTENVTVGVAAAHLAFRLRWTDEPASTPGTTNSPDTFRLTVRAPDGKEAKSPEVSNPQGGEGVLNVTLDAAPAGSYWLTVTCVNAGGEEVVTFVLPVSPAPDSGNEWKLDVSEIA